MRTAALVLTFLTITCHGNNQALHDSRGTMQSLTSLLLANMPSAGFHTVGMRFLGNTRAGNNLHSKVAALQPRLPQVEMDAEGPVAIVTGASRGIGRAIALALGAEGCRVVVNYANSAEAAEEVVKEIKASGGDGVAVKADMSTVEGVQDLFKATAEAFSDPVSVLVNNAGINKDGLALRMKQDQWLDVINTNLNGVFYASQAASKVMAKKRNGRIINIASVVGRVGNVGQVNYASAKGGVLAMTMTLAKEFAGRSVTVNAIAPGFIESDMTNAMGEDALEKVKKDIPVGRFGKPEEVAGLVKYLALDPSAAYITGHCLNIDGGLAIGTC